MREPVPDDERPVVDRDLPATDELDLRPDDERPVSGAGDDPSAPVPDDERPVPAGAEGAEGIDDADGRP